MDLESLAARAVAIVTAHGAVPRSEIRAFRPHLEPLRPLLLAAGVEVGATTIRRPLSQQISELVRADAFVATKGLEKRVQGANAREVAAAIDALVAAKALVRVLRESGPGLAQAASDVLEGDDLSDLRRRMARLQKLLKTSTTKKMPLLLSDVEALIGPPSAATKHAGPVALGGGHELVDAIARRVVATKLPMRVPDLLRALGAPLEEAKRALVDGARRGLFDLEPESGMGRLSPDDARLCPVGPMGSRLSWVRARAVAGAKA